MEQDKLNKEQNNPEESGDEFVSDTQKVVRRHLENKEDVITEEDIANVRVGMTPPGSVSGEELNEKIEEKVDELTDGSDEKDNTKPSDQPITPWDTTT